MDLIRKIDGKHWECPIATWKRILELAKKGGYMPLGTAQYDLDTGEPDDNWDNNDYTSQSGQLVVEKDAQHLAESLGQFIATNSLTEEEQGVVFEFVQWLTMSNDARGEHCYPGFEIW